MIHFARSLVFMAVLTGAPHWLFAQANDARESFGKAYQLYVKGKPAQAKEGFQLSAGESEILADSSLYYLARIALDEANWSQSRK